MGKPERTDTVRILLLATVPAVIVMALGFAALQWISSKPEIRAVPPPSPPFRVGVIGGGSILNDGSSTDVRIRLTNVSKLDLDLSQATVRVALELGEYPDNEFWALTTNSEVACGDMSDGMQISTEGWSSQTTNPGCFATEHAWKLSAAIEDDQAPQHSIEAGNFFDIVITNITTYFPSGQTAVTINYGGVSASSPHESIAQTGTATLVLAKATLQARDADDDSDAATLISGNLSVKGNSQVDGSLGIGSDPVDARKLQVGGATGIAGDLTIDGAAGIAGDLTVEGSVNNDRGHQIIVPSGTIVMAGSDLCRNLPLGWTLCDGKNDCPDLRDRFIIGAQSNGGQALDGVPYPDELDGPDGHPHQHKLDLDLSISAAEKQEHGKYHQAKTGEQGAKHVRYNWTTWRPWPLDNKQHYVYLPEDHKGHVHMWEQKNDETDFGFGPILENQNRPKWYALCFIMKH